MAVAGLAGSSAGVLAASGTAAPPAAVVPIPVVRATTARVAFHHHPRILVRSLRVSGLTAPRPIVTCDGCLRFTGPIRRSTPAAGTVLYVGVNWLLVPGHAIKVATYRRGAVGRYELLTASAQATRGLVFKASGCLRSLTRAVACPQGVGTPITGGVVTPKTTGGQTQGALTTAIASGPSGTVATLPVNFTYSSNAASATFECNLDGVGWVACPSSGISYASMTPGSHTFAVRAFVGSQVDPQPPQRTWTQVVPGATTMTSTMPTTTSTPPPPVVPAPPAAVTHYNCPATATSVGHYVPGGKHWGNDFIAQGTVITGGHLVIGANTDGGNHQATIGIFTGGPNALSGQLGTTTVNVSGYGGVDFTFSPPIQVSAGQSLWLEAIGVGDFTAYDQSSGGADGCFEGSLVGTA